MRIVANLTDNRIIEVVKTPEVGTQTRFNGRYSLVVPEGADVVVEPQSSFVEILDRGYSGLLAQFPMYGNIIYNPLIEHTDIGDLDLTVGMTLPDTGPPHEVLWVRAQVGNTGDPGWPHGNVPNSTALYGVNDTVSPHRPGLLITDTIDISGLTGGHGADEFMVWWKIYSFSTSDDVSSDFGATAGRNDPAIRSIQEVLQEPAGLEVSLSINDGASFHGVGRLEPINFCDPGTKLRLAFLNRDPKRVYLAAYAIMF
jgi:hypothetical protein